MESGEHRDRIAAAKGVIAFEVGGAGVWDSFPCVIIKGACDYADGHRHKSKVWQRYSAATAAACAKAFLSFWVSSSTQDYLQGTVHVHPPVPDNIVLAMYLSESGWPLDVADDKFGGGWLPTVSN
ncbi:hypothetical protein FANTH_12345 [Fusarium anthophilum]|uniref:Uncharacterized protein n=1 Tax=Fusarium anthophilum TaxID=48485 RepID=A0A8H4YTQ0_9HYPO|nr:hypothetical protein FANTH_12345 [Fusarium anthophilum]